MTPDNLFTFLGNEGVRAFVSSLEELGILSYDHRHDVIQFHVKTVTGETFRTMAQEAAAGRTLTGKKPR